MFNDNPKLPNWAISSFRKLLPTEVQDGALQDFEDTFNEISSRKNRLFANIWIIVQLLQMTPSVLIFKLLWSSSMLKNYLKLAYRNIVRNKAFSFINLVGFGIGMASFVFMLLWVNDELSFDKQHKNIDSIFRVIEEEIDDGDLVLSSLTQPPVSPGLKSDFPEVLRASRYENNNKYIVSFDDKKYNESNYAYADPDFFEMFSFEFKYGDPENVFDTPKSVVITADIAQKYFGNSDPLGKVLLLNSEIDATVTGVIEKISKNSTLVFDFISPFDQPFIAEETLGNWGAGFHYSFLQLEENVSVEQFEKKIYDYIGEHDAESTDKIKLQKFSDIHLYSNLPYDFDNIGNIKYVFIFISLALLILVIAAINFMNLSTVKSLNRAKEIGIRKVSGAYKANIIKQFLLESILMSCGAAVISLIIVYLFIPEFNEISGKFIVFDLHDNIALVGSLFATALFTGFISGIYPAFYIGSFSPVQALKGNLGAGTSSSSKFRKALVITQFSLSTFLIICSGIVTYQLNYVSNADLGYSKENLVVLPTQSNMNSSYSSFKNEILQISGITNVTRSFSLPTGIRSSPGTPEYENMEPDENWNIKVDLVDFDYTETFGMEMVMGRSFSKDFGTDDSLAYIVNEAAATKMNMTSPIGKRFSIMGHDGLIIGVVKNFHHRSMHTQIEPLVLKILPWWTRTIIKLDTNDLSGTLAQLENSWSEFYPNTPFEVSFFDERFEALYRAERQVDKVVNLFTLLAIIIACLGLFGLSAFVTEKRSKEIGIRKVLGASSSRIAALLSYEFSKSIVLANVLAWPVSWYLMNNWLNNFAYHVELKIFMFFLPSIITLIVALATVSIHTLKVAFSNPVDSLKHE